MAMELDEVLHRLGKYGKWQMGHYSILGLSFGLTTSWQLFAIIFIGYYNYHVCELPPGWNITMGIPLELDDTGYLTYSQCSRYVDPYTSNETMACDNGWQYQRDRFTEDGTIVMEWDLVCNKGAFVETSQTIFNVGVVVGFFVFTPWGDRYGRKKVFFICQLLMSTFGVAMAFSPTFEVFCAFQFLTGACSAGLLMAGTVLALEMFASDVREFLAPMTYLFSALGMVTLVAWAYVLPNWRHLQLAISVAGFVPLVYIFWCPESLRWLVVNNKLKEANVYLARAGVMNKVDLPESPLGEEPPKEKKEKKEGNCCGAYCGAPDEEDPDTPRSEFIPYLRSSRPRRYFIIMIYLVFADNIMYYGLSLLSGALESLDLYLNMFINSVLEFPAILLSIVVMAYFGRKGPIIFFHISAGICMAVCGIISIVPLDPEFEAAGGRINVISAMAFLGKFCVSAAWCVMFVFAQEIFPTNMRNTGLGFVAGAGYIGSIIAPYAVYLFRISPWIPTTIFAVMAIIAGLLTIMIPETMGRDLPTSVADVASWNLKLTPDEKIAFKAQRRRLSASAGYGMKTVVNSPSGLNLDTKAEVDAKLGLADSPKMRRTGKVDNPVSYNNDAFDPESTVL